MATRRRSVNKVHPAVKEAQKINTSTQGPVQPIETVRNVPGSGDESSETVLVNNSPNLQVNGSAIEPVEPVAPVESTSTEKDYCWNCANHDKTSVLDDDGVCSKCGFVKDDLYNGNLEAEKARQRMLAGQQL